MPMYVEEAGHAPADAPAMAATWASSPALPRHGLAVKLLYGLGSAAFGVKDNGFTVLLMLFYNQALGVPAATVGLAVMIALIVDAIFDPLIGAWSDNVRSRLGRRHPFMYASAIPIAVSYFFLWSPPAGLGADGLFWYLLVLSIGVRLFLSLYEIPSAALVVDLARDYDERTSFLSYRYFMAWAGGLTMGVAAFSVFLQPNDTYASGTLNLEGYRAYGLLASSIMLVAILASALGTQRFVSTFAPAPPRRPFDLARSVREAWGTLANRPFLTIAGATLFAAASAGIASAALTYFRIYFWQLRGDQISFLMVGNVASIFVSLVFAPRFSARFGKKRAAIILWIAMILLSPIMYWGRLLDLLPRNGSTFLYQLLFLSSFVNTIMSVSLGIVGASLLADVVDHSNAHTGRQAAGLIFSSNALLQKATSGIGVFGAGVILTLVDFPKGAAVGSVDGAILTRLAFIEPVVVASLQACALLLVAGYPITRAMHEHNLRRIALRRSAQEN